MSTDLEAMGDSMVNGLVPDMWSSVAYPSLKPLGSWINDLIARIDMLRVWIDHGKPTVYWISGFFFPQGFITGTRQNFARRHTIPIDLVKYDFEVLTEYEPQKVAASPDDGAYVHGLFLEGARWSTDEQVLVESRPKELFTSMPIIYLKPIKFTGDDDEEHRYECPCYRTSLRWGMLSTTGHSTNFVMFFKLTMKSSDTEKKWILRGAALLSSLDD